jgi:bifunctional non-homologous end joining protein LigD
MASARTTAERTRRKIAISKPDKVLFPDSGTTKGELAAYYEKVADVMLPHVAERAVVMHRFPDGAGRDGFYQKDAPDYFPDWIRTVELAKRGGTVRHVVIDRPATLVYLAGQACITPHVWLSRVDRPDHPDRMVFDLDPQRDDFDVVRAAARALRDVLTALELVAFVMTSGSRGLHVVVPLDRSADFDTVRGFARTVADLLVRHDRNRFTTEQRKDKRRGRLFIDTLRNGYAQTSAPPWSVRPRPVAPVAVPLDWHELNRSGLGPQSYTVNNVFRRLAAKADPWRDIGRHARALGPARARLHALGTG